MERSAKSIHRAALVVAITFAAITLSFAVSRFIEARALGLADYVAYWSAGHACAAGQNPYSPSDLLAFQRTLGWAEAFPNMMYYPPWTLALVTPFGMLPYGPSRLFWLIVNLGLIVWCADRLWRYYAGDERRRLLAWVLALSFVPTLIVLRMGQIGPLLLLGVVGFLEFEKSGHDYLAGGSLLLPAIKPQLLFLFGLAVVAWAIDRRRWKIFAGGAFAILGALGVALAFDPHVLVEYRYALANPPSINITPTLGAMLRLAFGEEHTWLQWLPAAVGLGWLAFYWRRCDTWRWSEQAPILLLASFLATPYGAWVFDLVVLLVPLMHAAVWATTCDRRLMILALVGYIAIDVTALAMNLGGSTYPMFIWMTPALLGGYVCVRGAACRRPTITAG